MASQYRILRYLRRRGPALDDFLEKRFRVSNQVLADLSCSGYLFGSHTGHGVMYEITTSGVEYLRQVRSTQLGLVLAVLGILASVLIPLLTRS